MSWVPYADSQVAADFEFVSELATLQGSSVICAGLEFPEWVINTFNTPVRMRVTVVSYSNDGGGGGTAASFEWFDEDSEEVINEAPDTSTAFEPEQFEIESSAEGSQITYHPASSEGGTTEAFEFLLEVWEDIPATCEELGRVTRAYVSGYQRDRVHKSRIVRGEKRCLVANFNGAIPPARTIASAIWRCDQPFAVAMGNAKIFENDRSTAVDITAQYGSGARIKCQATLDNGEVYNQLFVVRVQNAPWFQGETAPAAGPYDLTVTV